MVSPSAALRPVVLETNSPQPAQPVDYPSRCRGAPEICDGL